MSFDAFIMGDFAPKLAALASGNKGGNRMNRLSIGGAALSATAVKRASLYHRAPSRGSISSMVQKDPQFGSMAKASASMPIRLDAMNEENAAQKPTEPAQKPMPRVSSFLEPLRSEKTKLPRLLLLTVAEKPNFAFEHWLDITKDTAPIERVSDGLDGVYIEFQKEMLTEEGKAALKSLTQRRDVGVWTRAGRDPDNLLVAQTLIHECGVTFVNTDLPTSFSSPLIRASSPHLKSKEGPSPSTSRDNLPRISPASSREHLPRISPATSRDKLPRMARPDSPWGNRPPPQVTTVSQLVDKYDAFLLDQFGVLHDGTDALPGAIDCFAKLIAAGKKCVVLSNTSRRGGAGAGKLKGMGFAADSLSGFVASGELAFQYMLSEFKGKKALWFGWEGGFLNNNNSDYVDGLDLTFAPATEADFILCQGTQTLSDGKSVVPIGLFESGLPLKPFVASVLDSCAARKLTMICCNPDFTALISGGTKHMPGKLASEYEKRGGKVIGFGKPSTAAFEAALDLLSKGSYSKIEHKRVCHVGDSLHHDIAGANASGVDCLWVTASGIHAEELFEEGDAESATNVSPSAIRRVVNANGGHKPTHITMRFSWGGGSESPFFATAL